VCCYKPQFAHYAAYEAEDQLERTIDYIQGTYPHVPVILDSKRGDVGNTAERYALEAFERYHADAVTVNPYLGRDSLGPFLAACRRHGGGVFCVVKTSNAGGAEVQDLVLSDGRHVWHQVAELVAEWGADLVGEHGLSSVGAVIGATHPRAVGEARRLLPRAILLLPGVGAQGATPADVARAFTSGPASALVNVSRDVIYAFRVTGMDWRSAAAAEASKYAREVWAVSGW